MILYLFQNVSNLRVEITGFFLHVNFGYLTIRPVARKGYGSIAHEAKPNGLLTRGP